MELVRSKQTVFGLAVSAVAVTAMAVDHLMGDDPGLEDLATFLLASGISLAIAGIVFGVVVPRALRSADRLDRAARSGFVCSVLSAVSMVALWLGVPFALAGGGIALGLVGRQGRRRRRAIAAIVIGAIVLFLAGADYVEQAIRKTW